MCISCVSDSNITGFLVLRCTRILSQQVIAAVVGLVGISGDPREVVVRSGKDWAV